MIKSPVQSKAATSLKVGYWVRCPDGRLSRLDHVSMSQVHWQNYDPVEGCDGHLKEDGWAGTLYPPIDAKVVKDGILWGWCEKCKEHGYFDTALPHTENQVF